MGWSRMALVAAALTSCLLAAAEAKDRPKANEPFRAPPAELNAEWLGAVERLRVLPRPGEIKAAGVTANLCSVYELADGDASKCETLAKEYDAALLKLAAKWLEEEKALRAEYEARLVLLLPEAKREAARKALEFSHAHWVTPTDREAGFRKEYSERLTALRESRLRISAEEFEATGAKLKAWVKGRRAQLTQQDENVLRQIREMLAPDEAARLDQFDRNRPAKKNDK